MPLQTRDFLTQVHSNYSQTEVEASNQKTFYELENELQNPCKLQGTLAQIVLFVIIA